MRYLAAVSDASCGSLSGQMEARVEVGSGVATFRLGVLSLSTNTLDVLVLCVFLIIVAIVAMPASGLATTVVALCGTLVCGVVILCLVLSLMEAHAPRKHFEMAADMQAARTNVTTPPTSKITVAGSRSRDSTMTQFDVVLDDAYEAVLAAGKADT